MNKDFAVGLFSITIYMIIAVINSVLYFMFDCSMIKNLCHIYIHLLFSLVIYFLMGFFFGQRKRLDKKGVFIEREVIKKRTYYL